MKASANSLGRLLEVLPDARISGEVGIEIRNIACDSRSVGTGSLFVAIRGGEERDRHEFVADAVARGAAAVIVEKPAVRTGSATVVEVGDSRQALAKLAARFYGEPSRQLCTVGVTGTNGKTTTTMLIRAILDRSGRSCGYLGTLGSLISDTMKPLANTTPEASDLHRELRAMVDAGRAAVALEVSSHALALGRVDGIRFDAAVFTNLTRDHLDFHGSEEAYFEAKKKLFDLLKPDSSPRAAVNLDDPWGQRLSRCLNGSALTFGSGKDADVRLMSAAGRRGRTSLSLLTPHGKIDLDTRLTGSFNCSNAMAAVACALALGVDADTIAGALARFEGVPGRFERIDEGQPFEVIVDFAHTPAGLETVLNTARELATGRLICLFGCGGDRDQGKRPQMGKIAGELADEVFLTSDNPRSEPPGRIIGDIAAGMSSPQKAHLLPDRKEAIGLALQAAGGGDVVVLAGKGSETRQVFADHAIDFDDRHVAREWLRGRGASGIGEG